MLDREEWSKWWAKRWAANQRSQKLLGGDDGDPETSTGKVDDNSDGGSGGEGEGGGGGGERIRITRLAERARQARRRAGTDIHTAAWRGDLALVKVCSALRPSLFVSTGTLCSPSRPTAPSDQPRSLWCCTWHKRATDRDSITKETQGQQINSPHQCSCIENPYLY